MPSIARRRRARWLFAGLACAALAGASSNPAAAEPAAKIDQSAPHPAHAASATAALEARAARALHIGSCQLAFIDADTTPSRPLRVQAPIDGRIVTLDMVPFSVRSEIYQVIEHLPDGSYIQVKPAPVNTLRGFVPEVEGSMVAGGVMDDGLYAQVILSDTQRFWIQPARSVLPDAPPGLHVIYRNAQATDLIARCRTPDRVSTPDAGASPPITDRGGTQRWQALVAFDAEYGFYRKTGSSLLTQQMVNLILNVVNVQYEREVDIRHVLGTIIVRTFQNYDPTMDLSGQFRAWWNAHHADIPRDLAIQLDGNGNGGLSQGYAFICDTSNAYAGCGMDWPNLSYRTDVVAHEMGHLWGACHCVCASPPFTMNPITTLANRFEGASASTPVSDNACSFHASAVAQIVNHRNSRPQGCLDIVSVPTSVPNDQCASATLLPCNIAEAPYYPCTFGFSNRGATMDGPSQGCRFGDADIWYRYVAPCDGVLTASICTATFDTLLFAYRTSASCPPVLADQIACDDDSATCPPGGAASASQISFNVVRGSSYLIRLAGYGGAQGTGILSTSNTGCSAPPNDSCAAAIPATQAANVGFSTVNATTGHVIGPNRDSWLEAFCINGVGDDLQVSNDIWYSYLAPCTGSTRFSLCGSAYDTKIAIYDHCPFGDNQSIACNDDACGSQSSVDVNLNAGITYFIRIGGYHGAMGAGTLRIDSFACPPPPNDSVFAPTPIFASSVTGQTLGATHDGVAPCGSSDTSRDTWHTYTVPYDGNFTIDTCGSDFDTVLSLYTCCPGPGVPIGCSDDNPPAGCGIRISSLSFPVTLGQRFLIRIAGYQGAAGHYTINTRLVPFNNTCSAPTPVFAGSFAGSTLGATVDGSATCGTSNSTPDIWYRFRSDCSGLLELNTAGSSFDTVLSIQTGCPGTILGCNDDVQTGTLWSYLPVNIGPGFYYIRVSGFNGATGTVVLNVAPPPIANDGCAGATPVALGETSFATRCASTDPLSLPPWCEDAPGGIPFYDVWYRYTVTQPGTLELRICNTTFTTLLAVYAGSCPTSTGALICTAREDSCGDPPMGSINTFVGEQYLIRIGGYYGLNAAFAGSGTLDLTLIPYQPGACCTSTGGCSLATIATCTDSFQGEGTACVPSPCPATAGACCVGAAGPAASTCVILDAGPCAAAAGAFQGIGVTCNNGPGNPVACCTANFNEVAGLSVQDIFDFLSAFFASDPTADVNHSGTVTVQDIFDFLSAYFVGCA